VSKPLQGEDLFDFDDEEILLKLDRLFTDNGLADDQSPRDVNDYEMRGVRPEVPRNNGHLSLLRRRNR